MRAVALLLSIVSTSPGSQEITDLRQKISKLLPKDLNYEIKPGPIKGLHNIAIGPQILYVTDDGKYLIEGNIFDLETHANITQNLKKDARIRTLNGISEKETITFASNRPDAVTVNVFIDTECEYCRQLHKEMAEYNAKGINVRYFFFPREGAGSESYQMAQNIWCNASQREAMNAAFAGKTVARTNCATPIEKHIAIGKLMEIRGTPAIILPTGEYIAGYLNAEKIHEKITGTSQPAP